MAITLTTDMILGIGALIVAAVAIMMFLRATEGTKKPTDKEDDKSPIVVEVEPRKVKLPDLPTITERTQVELARTQIRTLTLQQEILSMVMKRLFEAEDNGEISKNERERLGKNYEAEMQKVDEQLKKAELIVSLNELEDIRQNIIEQFQQTLTSTQSQIDLIIKELNIQQPEPEKPEPEKPEPAPRPRRTRPRPPPPGEDTEEEPEDEDEGEESGGRGRRDTVEDRLDKLKQDVLKELEELERLELEQ
ncbi:MAG: hypothetical protein NWF07_09075 [Candidatus Bathyarchaeota archaeon]|nr:hypothetical protein [Candidatus Bathyarchaeota archaeon]